MVVRFALKLRWMAVTDDTVLPSYYATKAAALAAARAAERKAVAQPEAQSQPLAPLPALPPLDIAAETAWLRTPDMRAAARAAQLAYTDAALARRIAERDFV
jgi:hypothetical protein